tara:strand:+ start:98 stop:280 length:183 start_codon:yes stop_codon:yes gene_type:complete
MVNINEKRKVGRPKQNKQPLTEEEKRIKKNKINKGQTLLQTKQRNITPKSKEKIQGKNEK